MNSRLAGTPPGGRRAVEVGPLLALAGVPMALAIGLAAGAPVPEFQILGLASLGLLAVTIAALWPWAAVQVLFFSSIFLIVYIVTGLRAANAIDILLFPVIIGSIFGGVRARAIREIAARTDPAHRLIDAATRRLSRTTIMFYGVAVLSLVVLALRGHLAWALDSGLILVRALQGASFFAIGLWWFRTNRHLRVAIRSIEAGAWAMILVNIFYFATLHIGRAGQTWIVNLPSWPMSSPNDAGVALLFVWALLQALPDRERTLERKILMAGLIVLLIMTTSRSGLLAWTIYNLLTVRWLRWRTVFSAAALAVLAAVLVPQTYWSRIAKTVAIGGGSYEAYTSLVRVYGWHVAWRVFLDHPILGVGYLGFRFVSSAYNDLRIVIGPAESYYLETAAGMGIIGILALGAVLLALWRLGQVVRNSTPAGTFGNALAVRHQPMMLALFVVILTGNNFVGFVAVSQLAIWCALVVRAGHLAIEPPRT